MVTLPPVSRPSADAIGGCSGSTPGSSSSFIPNARRLAPNSTVGPPAPTSFGSSKAIVPSTRTSPGVGASTPAATPRSASSRALCTTPGGKAPAVVTTSGSGTCVAFTRPSKPSGWTRSLPSTFTVPSPTASASEMGAASSPCPARSRTVSWTPVSNCPSGLIVCRSDSLIRSSPSVHCQGTASAGAAAGCGGGVAGAGLVVGGDGAGSSPGAAAACASGPVAGGPLAPDPPFAGWPVSASPMNGNTTPPRARATRYMPFRSTSRTVARWLARSMGATCTASRFHASPGSVNTGTWTVRPSTVTCPRTSFRPPVSRV